MILGIGNDAAADSAVARRPTPRRQQGFTLVEVVLVLTLLAMLAALVVPVISDGFVTVRMRRGGDRVLAAWTQARATAIETGEVQQFVFMPQGNSFRIEPWTPLADDTATSPSPLGRVATPSTGLNSTATTSGPGGAAGTASDSTARKDEQLPEGITFHAGQGITTETSTAESEVQQLGSSGTTWSTPILFFPDGSTSEASVTIASDKGHFQRLTLRGLTGVGRASLVLTRQELTRLETAGRR